MKITKEKICPYCGSKDVKPSGRQHKIGGLDPNHPWSPYVIEYECMNCGMCFGVRER